jgi:methylmalonyl-CoA/ethylmalonyl-CoA epimerase
MNKANKNYNHHYFVLCGIIFSLLFLSVSSQAQQKKKTVKTKTAATAFNRMRADHICIGTSKFEETIQWYKDKLGFKELIRWTVKELPDLQLAYLELNGFRIEIIGTSKPRPAAEPVSDFAEHLRTQGYVHLCLEVKDVDAALEELNQRGVPTFVPAGTYPLANYQRRVAFVKDNNGNVIELGSKLIKTK